MLLTSVGYHTFTIFLKLTYDEAFSLLNDFKKYSRITGRIKIFTTDDTKNHYRIIYLNCDDNNGINKWQINFYESNPNFRLYTVEATINPKLLAGVKDYITAANIEYLKIAESKFNNEAEKISPILGKFSFYKFNRIDFCLNLDLVELDVKCKSEQMMILIKRAYVPAHFNEYKVYDKKSHRMKSYEHSFYLKSKSANVNCYSKYYQLLEDTPNNPSLNDSRNIIRFEVQCKYNKVYLLVKNIKKDGDHSMEEMMDYLIYDYDDKVIYRMLSDEVCMDIINDYYRRVILAGDYYSLEEAVKIVKSNHFRTTKESRMIGALKLISGCRGIHKAIEKLQNENQEQELSDLKQTLRELSNIQINPVTIPREWNIKHIPNLMEAYKRKVSNEHFKELMKTRSDELMNEYYAKKNKKFKKHK